MRGALASHMNLRRMQRAWKPIFTWDFTQQSAGALLLPSGVTFTRASSGYSVQDGDSQVVVGGAIASNDVPRVGRLSSAHNYGLFVEPPRTNLVPRSREIDNASWSPGLSVATTANADGGPDGATLADRSNVTSGGYGRYAAVSVNAGSAYSFSAWIKSASGSAQNHRMALAETASSFTTVATPNAPPTWQRVSGSRTPGATTNYFLPNDGSNRVPDGGPAALALNFYTDLHQVEAGKYPTSAIITTGSSATRAAERLTAPSAYSAAIPQNGRVGLYFRFRALASLSEFGSDDGQLCYGLGGTGDGGIWLDQYGLLLDGSDASRWAYAATPFPMARGTLIDLWCEWGNGTALAKYRVNSGAAQMISWSRNDVQPALTWASGLDLFCSETSWHFPAIAEIVTPFVPGHPPF